MQTKKTSHLVVSCKSKSKSKVQDLITLKNIEVKRGHLFQTVKKDPNPGLKTNKSLKTAVKKIKKTVRLSNWS
jgi:hypothetical protein